MIGVVTKPIGPYLNGSKFCEPEVIGASESSLAQLRRDSNESNDINKSLLITCRFKDCCNVYI